MKLNPESLAGVTSRHPWRTLGAWVVVIVLMGYLSATLLGDVLTDDMAFTNNPESARAETVVSDEFGGGGAAGAESTEFFVVQSDAPWDESSAAFVQELKADIDALGPGVIAPPVVTYADAEAMVAQLFTPDDHGVLIALQINGDAAGVIAGLRGPVANATAPGFQAQILTLEQLAELSGSDAGAAPADGPQAFILVTHEVALTGNLQFLNTVRAIEAVVTRRAGSDLAAPPFSGFDAEQQASSLISTDRRTTLVSVPIAEMSEEAAAELRTVAADAADDSHQVQVAGQMVMFADFMKIAEEDMASSERTGLLVALVVLVVVFGSIVAAILPLVMGVVAIGVALGLVALIGQLWDFNLFVQNIVTMIGLAVGIDYSLFIVSRYREERKKGYPKLDAIRLSGATASRAVFFSGSTVVIALLGMLTIPVSVFRSMAGGAILVTIMAIAASMTLLPAVLGLLGDKVNWPRLSRRARVDSSHDPKGGFWDRIARTVMARPVVFLLASVLVLGSLGAFYFQLHRGTNQNISALPEEFPSRQAFMTLVQEFHSGGATDPAEIVVQGDVTTPEVQAAVKALEQGIAQSDTFSNRIGIQQSDDGRTLLVSAYFAEDPLNDAAFDGVRELRGSIVPAAFAGVNAEVLVGGNTAMFVDFLTIVDSYQWIVLALVLGLSFLLLTVVFRSIVVPLKAIAMNLLSVAAAYGAVTLVFQKGFGIGFFNAIGLPFKEAEAIEAWLPLFLFSILFGLSMDYHVFLLTRIREEYDKTGDNTEAVAYGLRTTAGIITGAALIMVAVFGAFAAGRLGMFQQMGFGLAVAVFMDATIVRTLLVPASMRLLGDWNWYLPKWLGWLPKINVEGSEEPETPLVTTEFPAAATTREPVEP
ncbi:MAG TPA: MMPL family transporter [Actinomycetota bacterium]